MSILEAIYKNVDDIPDVKFRDLYELRDDGMYHLKPINGAVPESELDAIRAELKAERKAHRKTRESISVETLDTVSAADVEKRRNAERREWAKRWHANGRPTLKNRDLQYHFERILDGYGAKS